MHILLVILLFILVCVAVVVFFPFIATVVGVGALIVWLVVIPYAKAHHTDASTADALPPAPAYVQSVQTDNALSNTQADPPPVAISPPEPAPDAAPPSTDNVMQTMAPQSPQDGPAPPPALDQGAPASDGTERH